MQRTQDPGAPRRRSLRVQRLDRKALVEHLDALLRIEAAARTDLGDAYSHEQWTAEHFLTDRSGKWEFSAGAFRDGRLLGFLIASRTTDAVHIHRVAVLHEAQRTGIARALLEHVERVARKRGVRRLTLSVAAENTGAIAAWRRLGFAPGPGLNLYFRLI